MSEAGLEHASLLRETKLQSCKLLSVPSLGMNKQQPGQPTAGSIQNRAEGAEQGEQGEQSKGTE